MATEAALIDRWGRAHRLASTTHIGRTSTDNSICILTGTVSRRHAEIVRIGGTWRLRDHASTNGTRVDGEQVAGEIELHDRQHVAIGRVAFYFVADATGMPAVSRANSVTLRPPSENEGATVEFAAQPDEVVFELQQPTGGGGAMMRVAGTNVQLTIAQQELMSMLVERMLAELDLDASIRGFVTTEELQDRLSLESSAAAADNVRQLVRRVRKLLVKAGVGDLIESRPGHGYRLLVIPRSG